MDATPADVAALKAPLTAADAAASADAVVPAAAAAGRGGSPAAGARLLLLFAGEACHVRYIGTTHGAYLTGWEQAGALLESLGGG